MNVYTHQLLPNTDHSTVALSKFIDGPAPAGWVTFYHEQKGKRIGLPIADAKVHDPELYERLKRIKGKVQMGPEDHARLARLQDKLPTYGYVPRGPVKSNYWMR